MILLCKTRVSNLKGISHQQINVLFLSGDASYTYSYILDIRLDFASLLVREVKKYGILTMIDCLYAIKKNLQKT